MFSTRNQIEKIIINAMDRFVWFILLVVMSHLITEFTRVTGYARGSRNDVILINDTLLHSMPVQNMIFYPGQEYGIYEQPGYYNTNNNNNNQNLHNSNNMMQANAPVIVAPASNNNPNAEISGFSFSFRPLIDSIFEIPISTLRAVNNLVARLSGSYQQVPSQKFANTDMVRSVGGGGATAAGSGEVPFQASSGGGVYSSSVLTSTSDGAKALKKSLIREEIA